MGRSYTIKYFARVVKKKYGPKYEIFTGMSISDVLKDYILKSRYLSKGKKFQIWEQEHPEKEMFIKIKKTIKLPARQKGKIDNIHDIFRKGGLDYNKSISRKYYDVYKRSNGW